MMERSLEVAMGVTKDPETTIMSAMKGWINHLRDRKLDSTLTPEFQQILIRLCSLTALMRTTVDRDFKRKLVSPAVPELPTRLIGQMVTASLSYSAVFGQNTPDIKVHNHIVKILRDTINPRSNRFKICNFLMENPNVDAYQLMDGTLIPKSTLNEEIEDLMELGFLHASHKASDSPGRRRHVFRLDDRIASPMRDLL
jgi:predicted transcriptional regulator